MIVCTLSVVKCAHSSCGKYLGIIEGQTDYMYCSIGCVRSEMQRYIMAIEEKEREAVETWNSANGVEE